MSHAKEALKELLDQLHLHLSSPDEEPRPLLLSFDQEMHLLGPTVSICAEMLDLVAAVLDYFECHDTIALAVFTKQLEIMLANVKTTPPGGSVRH